MSWLITQTLEALNLEHVQRLYADKSKVKAYITGFPVNVAVDLDPEVARRVVRDIVDQVVQGYSVEVVGDEVRRITTCGNCAREPSPRRQPERPVEPDHLAVEQRVGDDRLHQLRVLLRPTRAAAGAAPAPPGSFLVSPGSPAIIGVSITPGAMVITRIAWSARSRAAVSVSDDHAALAGRVRRLPDLPVVRRHAGGHHHQPAVAVDRLVARSWPAPPAGAR